MVPGRADAPAAMLLQVLDGATPANTRAIRVDVAPGTRERYSGGFPRLLEETVLGKLGMKHSSYQQPLPSAWAARTATAYRRDGTPVPGRWHIYPEMAAAGLWTTPSDLARFAIEIQKSRQGKSNKVLSAAWTRASRRFWRRRWTRDKARW